MAFFFMLGFIVYARAVEHRSVNRHMYEADVGVANTRATAGDGGGGSGDGGGDGGSDVSGDVGGGADGSGGTAPAKLLWVYPYLSEVIALVVTMACTALALLSKEMGVTLPLLCR